MEAKGSEVSEGVKERSMEMESEGGNHFILVFSLLLCLWKKILWVMMIATTGFLNEWWGEAWKGRAKEESFSLHSIIYYLFMILWCPAVTLNRKSKSVRCEDLDALNDATEHHSFLKRYYL